MRVLILLSGGIDSTYALYKRVCESNEVIALFVDYNQKAKEKEEQACERICDELDVPLIKRSVNIYEGVSSSVLRSGNKSDSYVVPSRNLFLLTCGMIWARELNIQALTGGFASEEATKETTAAPDNKKVFYDKFREIIDIYSKRKVHILSACEGVSKIKQASVLMKNNLLDLTYSCYEGSDPTCGECKGCKERERIVKEVKK